jgi:hypothetical protein
MIGRLAARSLTAHPVRSAVLALGFGVGVAVMAILLGVAEIVLRQAQSPALVGGGDVLIRLSSAVPVQLMLAGTLQAGELRDRIGTASPYATSDLYLTVNGRRSRVQARAGIPSLEKALGDPETAPVDAWRDTAEDRRWTLQTPDAVLRQVDRFHAIPDAPRWADSWAEWLYFNGRSDQARFYLTFLVGSTTDDGGRAAGVRLQLDRGDGVETFSGTATLTQEEVDEAPDLTIGASSVRLEGLTYRIRLELEEVSNQEVGNQRSVISNQGGGIRNRPSRSRVASGRRVTGELALQASPGRLVPPLEIRGSGGWVTGYVVPVMSGELDGWVEVGGERISFDNGTGYHDHNWGFWEGVSWRWGQVQHDDLSLLYGRVFAPPEAADPERMPGFVGVLGPDGPIAYAQDVRITETDDEDGNPARVAISARGPAMDLTMRFDVESIVTNRTEGGPWASGMDFLQMRGTYTVEGVANRRRISFTAPGAAETFRGE